MRFGADKRDRARRGFRWRDLAAIACCLVVLSACGPGIDLEEALEVSDLTGGWYDVGVVAGRNKLVPTVSFNLRKTIDREIRPLSLNIAFRRLTEEGEVEMDDVFLQRVEFAEGDQTGQLVVRSETGYTAEPPQSRAEMLQHSGFQDVRAIIFAKRGGPHWTEVARYDLPRQLLTK